MADPGRPTKLTPDRHRLIVELLESGNSQATAAQAAGVHPATLQRWLARGRPDDPDAPDTPDDDTEPYRSLWHAVEEARARAEATMVVMIRRAGATDWRAAAWFLERSRPQEWGRSTRLEHVGDGGGPVMLDHTHGTMDPAAAAAAHTFLTALGDTEDDPGPDDEGQPDA